MFSYGTNSQARNMRYFGVVIWSLVLLGGRVVATATLTSGAVGPDQQHGKNIVNLPANFFAAPANSGQYKIETELQIQNAHVRDRAHPYPRPAPGFEHHHALEPTAFTFSERFWILNSGSTGSQAAILPGIPTDPTKLKDPYKTSYEFKFRKEGNARFVLDKDHPWKGKVNIIDDESEVNSFGFSVSVLGSGGGINFGWDNPNSAPFTMDSSGNVDNPGFTMSFAPGFTMDHGSLFSVSGWVENDNIDVFGRIQSLGNATVIEDVSVLGGPEVVGFMRAPVYDVTHGDPGKPVPEPVSAGLAFMSLFVLAFRTNRKSG